MAGNTGKRLRPDQWAEIRQKYFEGAKITALAKEYGVNRQTIHTKLSREGWKRPVEIKREAFFDVQEEMRRDFREQAVRKCSGIRKSSLKHASFA